MFVSVVEHIWLVGFFEQRLIGLINTSITRERSHALATLYPCSTYSVISRLLKLLQVKSDIRGVIKEKKIMHYSTEL